MVEHGVRNMVCVCKCVAGDDDDVVVRVPIVRGAQSRWLKSAKSLKSNGYDEHNVRDVC